MSDVIPLVCLQHFFFGPVAVGLLRIRSFNIELCVSIVHKLTLNATLLIYVLYITTIETTAVGPMKRLEVFG